MARIFRTFLLLTALLTLPFFLWPGLVLVGDLRDPAMSGPGIPAHARELHAALTAALTKRLGRSISLTPT